LTASPDLLESLVKLANLAHPVSPELPDLKETWDLLVPREVLVYKDLVETLENPVILVSLAKWVLPEKMESTERRVALVDQEHLVPLVSLVQEENLA